MMTRGGRVIDLISPRAEDIDTIEVAWTLAYENRFCGNCGDYSVAQHAVNVAKIVRELAIIYPDPSKNRSKLILAGLHHDDVEAITGDLPQPVKRECPSFQDLEAKLQSVIDIKYGINTNNELVRKADLIAFCAEARMLTNDPKVHEVYSEDVGFNISTFYRGLQPSWEDVIPWPTNLAFARYMDMHERYS